MKLLAVVTVFIALAAALPARAALPEDIEKGPSCEVCQMNREKFAHSRAYAEWEDGSISYLCSINCLAAVQAQSPEKKTKKLLVADHDTKELLHSRKAFWVIGGSEKGVMTKQAKWAFATQSAADAFIAKNGGEPSTFDNVLTLARQTIMQPKSKMHGQAASGQAQSGHMEPGQAMSGHMAPDQAQSGHMEPGQTVQEHK